MRYLVLLTALLFGACNIDPYTLTSDQGGEGQDGIDADDSSDGSDKDGGDGPLDDGGMRIDGGPKIDGGPQPDACLPSFEVCDEVDNDCDGTTDEGFDLTKDPSNCGECGKTCMFPGAFAKCEASQCVEDGCKPGFVDTDPAQPGCEYACIQTNGGTEICDLVDNDCDEQIDEDFGLDDDVDNCGACGNKCVLLHATPKCVDADGDGLGKCEVATCDTGFNDNNPAVPGCEYQCSKTNGGVEKCDGIDNDCDEGAMGGGVDEGNPGGGASCGTDMGICTAGMTVCSFGTLQCVGATTGNPEVCDNQDNDCDGAVDDGFDKQNDINHCGSCSPCNIPFATPKCTTGMCGIQACQFGHQNNDNNQANGCEYACIPTGSELCDGVDNDCDKGLPGGGTDEGFNTQTDPNNCGMCGKTCSFPNASASCVAGGCVQGPCAPGFFDLNPSIAGCEYACTVSNGGVETCDNLDNDCDGTKDEGNPGGGVACGTNTGECATGTNQCVAGQLVCQGGTGPTVEVCDNQDDDCDGAIDDGFDKQNDPTHCGTNCTVCAFTNAVPKCTAGMCGILVCQAGFVDADGMASNGCEYACTPSGIEICDGKDNDCDKLTDMADPSLGAPPAICDTQGECAGTTATCSGAGGWVCNYADPDVEKTPSGGVVLEETRCDGKDNDCDGGADESFPLKNTACAEDGTFGTTRKIGACRGTGTLQCTPNMPNAGLRCNVTMAGAAPANETCDNKDNDCDGFTDELWAGSAFPGAPTFQGVSDATVTIMAGGTLGTYKIYDFEASRPDALSNNPGFTETRACSAASRIPWASASFNEASAACAAAGMRLCRVTRNAQGVVTADEWGRACQADGGAPPFDQEYPYGATYQPNTCNGSDFDPVSGTPANEDQAVASGSLASCVSSGIGVNDLSGNLKEWVNDPRLADGQTVHTLRGGAFDNGSGGLTCDFQFTVAEPSYFFPNVGFRCCSANCAAGEADCGGTCRNLSNNASHCGACGNACAGGNTCQNGKCCPSGQVNCSGVCCASGSCVSGVCQ